jgi:hypothetical protein
MLEGQEILFNMLIPNGPSLSAKLKHGYPGFLLPL